MRSAVQLQHPDESDQRKLLRLGLTIDIGTAIGFRVMETLDAVSPYATRNMPGNERWNTPLVVLGEHLVPAAWTRTVRDQIEMVVNPTGSIAIAVTSASSGVGKKGTRVVTKYRRGAASHRHVLLNALNFGLFTADQMRPTRVAEDARKSKLSVWYLMHEYADGELALELVLATRLDADGRTVEDADRIFLGRFGYGEDMPMFGDLPPRIDPPRGPTILIEPR